MSFFVPNFTSNKSLMLYEKVCNYYARRRAANQEQASADANSRQIFHLAPCKPGKLGRLIPSAVDLKLILFCRILRGGRHFRSLHKKKSSKAV